MTKTQGESNLVLNFTDNTGDRLEVDLVKGGTVMFETVHRGEHIGAICALGVDEVRALHDALGEFLAVEDPKIGLVRA
jgi:hypothetical protein